MAFTSRADLRILALHIVGGTIDSAIWGMALKYSDPNRRLSRQRFGFDKSRLERSTPVA
jgi:hypothetical protein